MFRRLLALVACALVLASCRLDAQVDVFVDADGTGLITVTLTADAELVAEVPTIADELALDDVIAAGWSIDGPNNTPDGGITLTMSHPFQSAAEATNLLQSLGPPFAGMELGRGVSGDVTTNRLSGRLVLVDGFTAFADDDLVTAVGSVPFADRIAATGATPDTALSVTLRASLPGDLDAESTNVEADGEVLTWTAPLDGTVAQVQAESLQQPAEGRQWARPLSIAALVALIAWVLFMGSFIVYVSLARWRRARRYQRRNLRLPQ